MTYDLYTAIIIYLDNLTATAPNQFVHFENSCEKRFTTCLVFLVHTIVL